MTSQNESASLRARHLIKLTRSLIDRMTFERDALQAHRPQDMADGMAETQALANQYRRESAQAKANPDFLRLISDQERVELIEATQAFETVLSEHAQTVDAARQVSEGLVKAIATEVAGARAQGTGYGASGHATAGDGRAVALNRLA
ncbi:flagellar basal-body protein FlbY [Brevundimonas vesicularis]|uniref:flagellar basal-body protein FlbY n=1 Tax=Brevundimonas vesicularis TaxID=41276 RepID=UPI0038D3ACC5